MSANLSLMRTSAGGDKDSRRTLAASKARLDRPPKFRYNFGMGKFNLVFNDRSSKTLDDLAKSRSVSKTEVVRNALNVYSALEESARGGSKIYVESPDGEKMLVVLP